jgi:hypothetical protein
LQAPEALPKIPAGSLLNDFAKSVDQWRVFGYPIRLVILQRQPFGTHNLTSFASDGWRAATYNLITPRLAFGDRNFIIESDVSVIQRKFRIHTLEFAVLSFKVVISP